MSNVPGSLGAEGRSWEEETGWKIGRENLEKKKDSLGGGKKKSQIMQAKVMGATQSFQESAKVF